MNKEVSLKKTLIIIIVIALIETVVLISIPLIKRINQESLQTKYCAKEKDLVCNDNRSLCYLYGLGKNDNTIVIWKGDCSNK